MSLERETRAILQLYGLQARKRFGQNFLIREDIVEGILDAAEVGPEDSVLEIGPGIGTMTNALLDRAGHVVAVEIDRDLEEVLKGRFGDRENFTLMIRDILKTDVKALVREYGRDGHMKVVANLPYYVTTPILMELLSRDAGFTGITVMVQKEVAERICAQPGTKAYGAITLAARYYSEPRIALAVPASSFMPSPKVESAVLQLTAREKPPVEAEPELLFAVIRAAFNQRRKTLANGIAGGLTLRGKRIAVTRADVEASLRELGMPATVRGETLSLEDFARVSESLRPAVERLCDFDTIGGA